MKYPSTQSGFSLVETLVAITILIIVIIGPMTISTKTSQSTSFASEQVTAYLLAQEGAELAQKARDDMMLDFYQGTRPNPWSDFTTGPAYVRCFNPNGCGIHMQVNGELSSPVNCGAIASPACILKYDSSGTVRSSYNHSTGIDTEYRRRIRFNLDGDEVRVISTVDWQTGDSATVRSVEVETYLFNIYDN
jgi:Tfp pilus assembly protein PilV